MNLVVNLEEVFVGDEWATTLGQAIRDVLTEEIKKAIKKKVTEDKQFKLTVDVLYGKAIKNTLTSK